jgi:P27 family predicted phage terminase small subunit
MTSVATGARKGGKPKVLKLAEGFQPLPAPEAPESLGEVGRRWWSALWQGGARWLDVESDYLLIELICRAQDKLAAIEEILEREGRYYETKQSQILPHPAVADSKSVSAQLVGWLSLCGFTPTDRARLGVAVKGVSELEIWRKKTNGMKPNFL